MNKNLKIVYAVMLSTGINAVEASNNYGARVSMTFDEGLVSKDVTAGNVESHLDNLAVALLEGREDLLLILDNQENIMDEAELGAAKSYAATMSKYEKAALTAALKQSGYLKNNAGEINVNWLQTHLAKRIQSLNWDEARRDVQRFLRSEKLEVIDLWSEAYFMRKLNRLTGHVLK